MAHSTNACPDSTMSLSEQEAAKFGPHTLPPCRVCGAQATGFHYGANTCEACKGFFHRSLSKKDQHVCLKTSKCELKPGNRSMCPACRYKRCLEVGMSKEGIKTGRYSYAKRTQDILELKALGKFPTKGKARAKKAAAAAATAAPVMSTSVSSASAPSTPAPATFPPFTPTASAPPTPAVSPSPPPPHHHPHYSPPPVIPPPLSQPLPAIKLEPTEKVQSIMKTVALIIEAKNKLLAQTVNQGMKQFSSMLQNGGSLDPSLLKHFGKGPNPLGSEAFGSTRLSTFSCPLDLNNILKDSDHPERTLRYFVNLLGGQGGVIKNLVDYIKAIPGFRELPMNDQIVLVKHCVAEVWLIGRFPMFNVETKQFTTAAGLTVSLDAVVGSDLADIMCSSAVKLQKLQMDEETNTLLSVFVVVSPDRADLEARDKVETIQENLLEAMLFVLKSKYGDKHMAKFAQLVEVLTGLRDVTELYLKLTNTLITKISDMPPLLTEILSLS